MRRLLIILILATQARAGVHHWTSRGPTRPGDVTAMFAEPGNTGVVYATTDAGIFKTSDGGSSWQRLSAGLTETHVSAATIRADDTATLFVGTRSGALFRTRNRGALWTEVARLPESVDSLVFDVVHGDLYARMGKNVARSRDDGTTWQNVTALPSTWQYDMATLHGYLYAQADQQLLVSGDEAATWVVLRSPINTFAVDAQNGSLVVSGTNCITRSFDDGKTWETLPCSTPQRAEFKLGATNGWIVDANAEGIFEYRDGAKSWDFVASLDVNVFSVQQIVPVDSAPAQVFAAYRFDTGTVATVSVTPGQPARNVDLDRGETSERSIDLAVSGADVYSAPCTIGDCEPEATLSKLGADASDWSSIDLPPATFSWPDGVVAPKPQTVIASTGMSLQKSNDGGLTWHMVNPRGVGQSLPSTLAASADGATIYAALSDGLEKSTDGGETWASAQNDLTLYLPYYGFDARVAVDPRDENTAYVSAVVDGSGASNLYKSGDGGHHWQQLSVSGAGWVLPAVVIDPFDSTRIYLSNGISVMRSTDAGLQWQRLNGAPCTGALAADPLRPMNVYLGCDSVYRSRDGGDSWQSLGDLPSAVHKMAIDPVLDRLYAATDSGVFEYDFDDSAAKTYTITLQAISGNFVSAANCGGRETQSNARLAGPCETLTLIDLNGGDLEDGDRIHVQASNGDYFAAENGGASSCGGCYSPVVANRRVARTWETFTIHRIVGAGPIADGDGISLQSISGDYVAAEGSGENGCQCDSRLVANRAKAGPWETFRLAIQP